MKNTKKNIIKAFWNLAAMETTATSEYGSIGVKKIIEMSNITKPTFYHYFKNFSDLLDSIKSEFFQPLNSILKAYHNDKYVLFSPIANEVLFYFYENRTIISIMRNSSIDFNYQQYLENIFYEYFLSFLRTKYPLFGLDSDWLAKYYSKVTLAILTTYISVPFPPPPDEFKPIFYSLINTKLNIYAEMQDFDING